MGEPELALTYFRAELIRVRRRQRELWFSGLYFHRAVAACFSEEAYYEEPLPDTLEDIRRQNAHREASAQSAIEARMRAW